MFTKLIFKFKMSITNIYYLSSISIISNIAKKLSRNEAVVNLLKLQCLFSYFLFFFAVHEAIVRPFN